MKKNIKRIILILAVLLLLQDLVFIYNNLQNTRTILGLRFHNVSVSGLMRAQLEEMITREAAKKSALTFTYQDKTIDVGQDEIGAKVDPALTANMLLAIGRTKNVWQNIKDQELALVGFKNISLKGKVSQALLTVKLLAIQEDIKVDPLPLRPDFVHDVNKTLAPQDGLSVNTDKLASLILDNIFNPPQKPLLLPTLQTFAATHTETELATIRKQASLLLQKPLSIRSDGLMFTLDTKDLIELATVVERPDPKNAKKLVLNFRLDDKKLNQKLGTFAEKVEAITHAEFDHHDARAALYAQFYSGKRGIIDVPTGRDIAYKKVLADSDSSGSKTCYLTFDDGPNSIYHPLVLDILKENNVHATFFLVGQNAKRDSAIAQRTKNEGHAIGNHSLTHSFLPNLNGTSILNELTTTNSILKTVNDNSDIKIFRPPYGGVNTFVKKAAEDLGLKMFLWDVDPRDWSEPPVDELVRRVVSNTRNGSDILLHSNHLSTVRALPKIIEQLRAKNCSFETLRE